jgi:putative endonuclease
MSSEVDTSLTLIVPRDYNFWVYIVTNRNHTVLYIGVTNSMARRITEHRQGTGANFPAAYRCSKLVFQEHYTHVHAALARETQLKKWSRTKKIALINESNPKWDDLGADVLQED